MISPRRPSTARPALHAELAITSPAQRHQPTKQRLVLSPTICNILSPIESTTPSDKPSKTYLFALTLFGSPPTLASSSSSKHKQQLWLTTMMPFWLACLPSMRVMTVLPPQPNGSCSISMKPQSFSNSVYHSNSYSLPRRHADRTVQIWLQKLKESPSTRRLNLIYLANGKF